MGSNQTPYTINVNGVNFTLYKPTDYKTIICPTGPTQAPFVPPSDSGYIVMKAEAPILVIDPGAEEKIRKEMRSYEVPNNIGYVDLPQ